MQLLKSRIRAEAEPLHDSLFAVFSPCAFPSGRHKAKKSSWSPQATMLTRDFYEALFLANAYES